MPGLSAALAATLAIGVVALPAAPDPPVPAFGTYAWPVQGPVLRGFEPPSSAYGAGHRGIDIGAPLGSPVRAPGEGVVTFAGSVAGARFVSIAHPDGVRTTVSWLSEILVARGDPVERGGLVGRSGVGHPGSARAHLHLSARAGEVYLDPMLLLEGAGLVGLVRLAPVPEGA